VIAGSLAITGVTSFDADEYAQYVIDRQAVIDTFDQIQALSLIKTRLNKTINT